jgi:hypothetical protein
MKYFDKETLKNFHNDIQKAMDAIAEKYEIERIVVGSRGKFSPIFFQKVININVANTSNIKEAIKEYVELQPNDERAKDIIELSIKGIPTDVIGKTFKLHGSEVTFIGFDRKATKFPLLGVSSNGKAYKFSPDFILESAG